MIVRERARRSYLTENGCVRNENPDTGIPKGERKQTEDEKLLRRLARSRKR